MPDQLYQHDKTRELVALITDAAELVRSKGEAAFKDFRVAGSRWRQEGIYLHAGPRGEHTRSSRSGAGR